MLTQTHIYIKKLNLMSTGIIFSSEQSQEIQIYLSGMSSANRNTKTETKCCGSTHRYTHKAL